MADEDKEPTAPSDAQDSVEDEPEDELTTPYRYSITAYGADYPVDGLVKRLVANDIVIPTFDPEPPETADVAGFQRDFVWTKFQCDRFVESLLLGLPVPGIFLVKQADQKLLVLDGQQRLRTLACFYDGLLRGKEFRLENSQVEYKGRTYKDLTVEDRRRLDDSLIHATIVRQDEPSDDQSSIYLVFERLNTGGTTLQPQEIRVALYRGPFIRLLRELNEDPRWRALYGLRSSKLKDQELILRFFALRFWRENYSRPMKDFLNRYTEQNRDLKLHDAHQLRSAFESTVDVVQKALGKPAFRRPKATALNAAVLDAVMVGVSTRIGSGGPITDEDALNTAHGILTNSSEFLEYTEKATADPDYVRKRIDLAVDAMAGVA